MKLQCYFIILCILYLPTCTSAMQMHEFFTELFSTDPVTTEYDAYRCLKESPLPVSINYVAIPWAALINNKKLDQVPALKLRGGFTVCQHIEYEKILPILQKIGVNTLFTPHAQKSKPRIKGITLLPFPHAAPHGTLPAHKKDILYSFIGMRNHRCRVALFALAAAPNAYIKRREKWHWFSPQEQQAIAQQEYQDVLARSRFSLCPRGTGPSTLRFWESLQAGAIPVHISDEGTLPSGFDWRLCVIDIPEAHVYKIDSILRALPPEKEAAMRIACLQAYEHFSGTNFTRVIHDYYNNT